jgi:hypothetical protein
MSFAAQAFCQRLVCNRREELGLKAAVMKAPVFWHVPGERNFVPSSSRPTGFPTQIGHNGPEPDPVVVRPLSTQWLSDEQIAEARRVWSKAYGRVISEDEAIEILMNVRRLAEVLLRAEGEKEEP